MASIINASASSSGLVTTADGSGIVKLQSNGVATNALMWGSYNFSSGAAPTLRSSFNTSSITRSSAGVYVFAMSANLSDSSYAPVVNANYYAGAGQSCIGYGATRATSSVTVWSSYPNATNGNVAMYDWGIDFVVFGN